MEEGTTEEMPVAKATTKVYPNPQASHVDVFNDYNLFWQTLKRFLFDMKIKSNKIKSFYAEWAPATTDGKVIDLHLLYKQVTTSDGYEKVDSENKWNEVCSVFNFVPMATIAPSYLKEQYLSLLYHYEQIYFFSRKGPLRTPPTPQVETAGKDISWSEEVALMEQINQFVDNDLIFDISELDVVAPPIPIPPLALVNPLSIPIFPAGTRCLGTIELKFDSGYVVFVKLGTEVLTGVVYLNPEKQQGCFDHYMVEDDTSVENDTVNEEIGVKNVRDLPHKKRLKIMHACQLEFDNARHESAETNLIPKAPSSNNLKQQARRAARKKLEYFHQYSNVNIQPMLF